MCGIAGALGDPEAPVAAMLGALVHRGPDGEGIHVSPDRQVILGSRRLAIVDVAGGQQPMGNEDGSVQVVYNGEIYNHVELREELAGRGHRFRTRCDTEVLVHLWEELGPEMLARLNGEFAIALHDATRGTLLLARDRLGIRPLYLAERGERLYFASELSALLRVPGIGGRVDPVALDQYLTLRYATGEGAMIEGIRRLPAGSWLLAGPGGRRTGRYWEIPASGSPPMPMAEAADRLDGLLQESVRMRLMSDVPLGLYLSGGVDSSLILAIAARQLAGPVRTFSIGFGLDLDETADAARLAKQLGTDHEEIALSPASFEDLPEVARALDEPIGDAIVLPTFRLSRHARERVKVVLTGEGADEIGAGYVHHKALSWFDRYRRLAPRWVQRHGPDLLERMPHALMDRLFPYPERLGPAARARVLGFLRQGTASSYLGLVGLFDTPHRESLLAPSFRDGVAHGWRDEIARALEDPGDGTTFLSRIVRLDTERWLPDYTLAKQDRLTMASSVEGRVPYLDHRIVELLATLPDGAKLRGLEGKRILRLVAARHLPPEVAHRKKRAFYLPVGRFFDRRFASFAQDVLAPSAIAADGFFAPPAVAAVLDRGLGDDILEGKRLMALLIFTLWVRARGIRA